jgi:hypothetical protein
MRSPSDAALMAEKFPEGFVSGLDAFAFPLDGAQDVEDCGAVEDVFNGDYKENQEILTIVRYEPEAKFGFDVSYSF